MTTFTFSMKGLFLSAFLIGSIASAEVSAQTAQELRAAAEAWLHRDQLKIDFKSASTGWTSTFETDVKAKTTNFVGSDDPFCLGPRVATSIAYVDNELVLDFVPRTGCRKVQYRFNPISGDGVVFSGSSEGGPLTATQSKISLRK